MVIVRKKGKSVSRYMAFGKTFKTQKKAIVYGKRQLKKKDGKSFDVGKVKMTLIKDVKRIVI